MVTTTVCPTMWYSPLTMSCEKRPDCLSPMRVASLSLAAFLALASSEEGFMVVFILKVLAAILLPPILAGGGLTVRPRVSGDIVTDPILLPSASWPGCASSARRAGEGKSSVMVRDHSPGKNWAGNYTYRAEKLHWPSTIEQAQQIIASAPAVRVLGSRHSFNDIADSSELITLEAMPTDVVVDHATNTISFNAALKYGELVETLSAEGVALHNLASLPHISVAGAVATDRKSVV